MDEKVMFSVHDMRNILMGLKDLVHHHMTSDERFAAEAMISRLSKGVESVYRDCLRCTGGPNDTEG